jgi:hypothetical protein
MNDEGSQSGDRDARVEAEDNVVRLTDWLGPHEELVPFGPNADAEDGSAAKPDRAGSVPTADDFWSESSAAVQDALTAPHADHRRRAPATRHALYGRASAAATWSRRRASLRGLRGPQTAPGPSRRYRSAGRAWAAAAAVLVAVALAVGVSGISLPGLPKAGHVAGRGATQPADTMIHGRAVASASRSLARRSARRAGPGVAGSRSAARHQAHARAPHHRTSAPVTSAQPVGYTTAASTPTYSTPTRTAAPYRPTSASTSSAPAATNAASTGSSSAAQSALGANGSLAPGSSPDG